MTSDDKRATVRSADRALELLEAIADEPAGLRLHELVDRTSIPTSTCHRILSTMEQRRFVEFSRRSSAWHVGRRAFRVGAAFARRKTFVVPALATMRRLRDATRETVNIAARDDGDVVILAQVESREVVRAINVVGGRAPMTSSALGKVMLASYDQVGLDVHVGRHGLPRCTPRSITGVEALRADLDETRRRGFAIDHEEHLLGLRCVAAPVFDASGDVVAALSVSGLAGRLEEVRLDRIGDIVARAAAELSHEQGGIIPATWRTQS